MFLSTILAVGGMLFAGLLSATPQGLQAPEAPGMQDYDYRSLAVASILTSAQEASKLPKIEERVALVIAAIKLFPPSHRNEAIALIERCLQDLKDLGTEERKGPTGRFTANSLNGELLAIYAKLDPERALAIQKKDLQEESSPSDINKFLRTGGKWSSEILARRGPADQAASLALSIVDTNPEQAFSLVIQSVKEGVVSNSINAIFEKLKQSQNRDLLDRLEVDVARSLASTMTMDSFSWGFAAGLLNDDRMPSVAKRGFIRFLMNSIEMWTTLVRGEDGNGGLDASYVSSSFTRVFLNVRPVIAKYSPSDILRFDILLNQASEFIPEKTKTVLQAFQPETLTDPRDRLNAILKDPSAEKRDLRLIGLASELLRGFETDESEARVELVADTVKEFSDSRLRSAFGDLLLLKRLNALVKVKRFVEAKKLVASISSDETRVWAMLALAEATSEDTVLAFELTRDALRAIEATSPSPSKVALALMAAALLAKDTPQLSFDALAMAAKYSNSSRDIVGNQDDVASAIRLEISIGKLSLILGREPKSLAEVRVNPRLALLARSDWFRTQTLVDSFPGSSLRLTLKLQFAGSVLSDSVKQTKPLPKRSSN